MLKCPECGGRMVVRGEPVQKYSDRKLRYRKCRECGCNAISHEVYAWDYTGAPSPIQLVKEQKKPAKKKREVCDEDCFHCYYYDCIKTC